MTSSCLVFIVIVIAANISCGCAFLNTCANSQCNLVKNRPQIVFKLGIFHSYNNQRTSTSIRHAENKQFDIPPNLSGVSNEIYLSAYPDRKSIVATWISQIILIGVSCVGGSLFEFHRMQMDNFRLSLADISLAFSIAVPLIVAGVLFDKLPLKISIETSRDTKIFVLRFLGRETSVLSAFALSILLSVTAGFSEEIFFRGFLMNSIDSFTGPPLGLIVSSVLFGLAHNPLWAANTYIEIILGGVFGYAYYLSDYNLAVPIIVHFLYDAVTFFVTWLEAKADLNSQIKRTVDKQVMYMKNLTDLDIKKLSVMVFSALDTNSDGGIDKAEFEAGIRLYGYGILPFSTARSSDEMFARTDLNSDGTITLEEFQSVVLADVTAIKNY